LQYPSFLSLLLPSLLSSADHASENKYFIT
jgi:hypothetical protein